MGYTLAMKTAVERRSFLCGLLAANAAMQFPEIPKEYLVEPDSIPGFWVASVEEVSRFLDGRVKKGRVVQIGRTAGQRPIRAVFYGEGRGGKGTTTFSGSLGFGDRRAYLGPDHAKKVYLGLAGVHGGEFEGMMGVVNLISVLETGQDLRGRAWPGITKSAAAVDRIILIPMLNVDGRARIPLRMIRHRGTDHFVHEYLNTGAKPDGSLLGWPQVKEFIPLDFAKTQFPGGYPNDAGVNIQHDDFFGARQPETQALFDLLARERPNLTLNMHTGANFLHPLRPFVEPSSMALFEAYYRRLLTRLTRMGLQASNDPAGTADPSRERIMAYNLDTAINLHCGSLSMTVESPSHNFSRAKRNGQAFAYTPDDLLDAQLACHEEAFGWLGAA